MRNSVVQLTSVLKHAILWIGAILYVYPFLFVLMSAVKSKPELARNPLGFPEQVTWENFRVAFEMMRYFRSLLNTAGIVFASVVCGVLVSAMAAYAIVRRAKAVYLGAYIYFLAGLILPFQMIMLPLYKIMIGGNLINTYHGLVFVYVGTMVPFSVFLFAGFVKSVPKELEEAATIDGANLFTTFLRIVLPLLTPAIATISVLNTFSLWNDFLTPLLYLQDSDKLTITVRLSSFVGQYFNDWSRIFAGIFLIAYPMLILYLFMQRFIINGITAGALKG